jgi:hypothetical protein
LTGGGERRSLGAPLQLETPMRASLLALATAAALGFAGAAAAQAVVTTPSEMLAAPPPATGEVSPSSTFIPKIAIPDPYARQLAFLKEKIRYYKAHDHGDLTPEHEAMLKRELQDLIARAPAIRLN